MKKQIIALAFAASTAISAQAEVIKYHSSYAHPDVKNDLGLFGIDLREVEGVTIWVEKNDTSHNQKYKLKRLEVDLARNHNLIFSDIDYPYSPTVVSANTSAWMFNDIRMEGEFQVDGSDPRLQFKVWIPRDVDEYNRTVELMEFFISDFQPQGENPVADRITTTVKDKKLELELLSREERDPRSGRTYFAIKSNWFGHGLKVIQLPADRFPNEEADIAIGLELHKRDGDIDPEWGQNYDVSIKFASNPDNFHPMGDLKNLLSTAYKNDNVPF